MSYDIRIVDRTNEKELYWGNYTSNVHDMLQEAFRTIKIRFNEYIPLTFHKWHDPLEIGEDPLKYLGLLIEELKQHHDYYMDFEPANKWGTVDGLIQFLEGIKLRMEEYNEKNILWEVYVTW